MMDVMEYPYEKEKTAEQQLWMAVLIQAFVDIYTTTISPNDRARARDFISRPSKELNGVCLVAGIPMSSVIKASKRGFSKKWLLNIQQSRRNMS